MSFDYTRRCGCGSGECATPEYDARGIYLCAACPACRDRKLAGYRPEVRTNPNYECDEPIEPEEYY